MRPCSKGSFKLFAFFSKPIDLQEIDDILQTLSEPFPQSGL